MARGFDTTFGTASTDVISCAAFTTPNAITISAWYWRNGVGGLSSGRIIDKTGSAVNEVGLQWRNTSSSLRFARTFSTTAGGWDVTSAPAVSTGQWVHVLVVYDGSATANNPSIYINGQSVSVTRTTAPVGTVTSASGVLTIGNRSTGSTNWDGMIGDVAIWSEANAGAAAAMARALYSGVDPRTIRPQYLAEYVQSQGKPCSPIKSIQPTVTGTKPRADRMLAANDKGFPFGYVAAGGATAVPVFMHHRQMQGMS